MAGIAYPTWFTLKGNLKTILEEVATEENAIDTGRNFLVSRDRWRPWIEKQQNVALVNVMVDTVEPGGGGTVIYKQQRVQVNLDLYALGTWEDQSGSLTPADEVAAKRLDLLSAQVLEAITRMVNYDFGFSPGEIDRGDMQLNLMTYQQENEDAIGQYAPARWSFQVGVPYFPTEGTTGTLEELNVDLTEFAAKFTYTVGV